jgi:hypothetical protein
MRHLLSGLFCLVALYMLCGCASYRDGLGGSIREPAGQTGPVAADKTQGATEAKTSNECSSTLVPEKAQTCRVDSPSCFVQNASPGAAAPELALPVVEVPEKFHDFGTMREDRDFVHEFHVKNVGSSELLVAKIIPGRGSRVARYDRVIPPGGEGTIKIAVSARSCSRGEKKFIMVNCNDPKTPYFFLVLTGKSNF